MDRPILNFSVALFLFISGYLTCQKIDDIKSFYKRRLLRVGIPYVIWSIAYMIPLVIKNTITIKRALTYLLTGKICVPFYFIFVYVQLVLVTPFIIKMAKSKYLFVGFTISPISIIITRYLLPYLDIKLSFPFGTENVFNWLLFYYLGILLGNNIISFKMNMKKEIVWYVICLVVSGLEGMLWYKQGNFDMATTQLRLSSILTSVVALLLSYSFITEDSYITHNNIFIRFMISLGNCSFGIYLSHMIFIMVFSRIHFLDIMSFPVLTILVLIISWLFVLIGERIFGAENSKKYLGL